MADENIVQSYCTVVPYIYTELVALVGVECDFVWWEKGY
jgi:hypothetical protein